MLASNSEDHLNDAAMDLDGVSLQTTERGTQESHEHSQAILYGCDAQVTLVGNFAYKRFHDAAFYTREVYILNKLALHPFIIHIIDKNDATNTLRYKRFETDLMQRLMAEERVPTRSFCLGLSSAVAHCHQADIVHRDIKPENVLVTADNEPILCDFARALFAPEPTLVGFAGTLAYASPEAIQGCCQKANDVWSMAVVFYCIVENLFPFDYDMEEEAITDARIDAIEFRPVLWEGEFETKLKIAIMQTFNLDPDMRPTVDDLSDFLNPVASVETPSVQLFV